MHRILAFALVCLLPTSNPCSDVSWSIAQACPTTRKSSSFDVDNMIKASNTRPLFQCRPSTHESRASPKRLQASTTTKIHRSTLPIATLPRKRYKVTTLITGTINIPASKADSRKVKEAEIQTRYQHLPHMTYLTKIIAVHVCHARQRLKSNTPNINSRPSRRNCWARVLGYMQRGRLSELGMMMMQGTRYYARAA